MTAQNSILCVQKNKRNLQLLSDVLNKEGYQPLGVTTLEEFDDLLAEGQGFDLALVDLVGFDDSIWQRCQKLRERGVAFLVLSARQSSTLQQTSLAHGARGVLVKPLMIKELLSLITGLIDEG